MAVSGVRDDAESSLRGFNELIFWQVMYRRLSLSRILRGSWLFATCAGLVATLIIVLLQFGSVHTSVYAMLGTLVLFHLLGRGWVEQQLPDPSFRNDLRTGNFEQLRLMPHTAHTLLIQRGLPDWLFRAVAMSLWLPLYVLASRVEGASFWDGVALWALFSFANYFVLGIVSFALVGSAWDGTPWLLAGALFGYALVLDGGRARAAIANSRLFSVMLALPILGRMALPPQFTIVLPDLRMFMLAWLLIELLRFERTARWVNAPSGVWRWFYWLPSAGLMALAGAVAWQESGAQGYSGAGQTHFVALGMFWVASALNLLLLTVRRQAESVLQPLRAHLWESGVLRLTALALTGGAVLLWGLEIGSGAFWAALLWLSFIEWLGGALFRRVAQRVHERAPAWAYGAVLLGILPGVVFWLKPLHPVLGALSPTFALLMASDAWQATGVSAQPPLWLCLFTPMLRSVSVLALLASGTLVARFRASRRNLSNTLSPKIEWYAFPLVYPLFDWWVRKHTTNPITRLTLMERQPAWALGFGVGMFLMGLLHEVVGAVNLALLIGLGIFLWLWGYHATARRVRRWLDSGELVGVFLAGLKPNQIYWGWVVGAWVHQLRVLIAAVSGYSWGWLVQALFTQPAPPGAIGLGWVLIGLSFGAGFYIIYLALWSCAWLIAAPSAIRDQLALPERAVPLLGPRAAILAAFYSLLGCCAPLAPFLLIGIPMYTSQSTIALHKLARAPGEPKR